MNVGRKLMLIVVTSVALVTIPSAGAIYYYTKHKLLASEAATLVAETRILSVSHTQKLADAGTSLKALSRLLQKKLAMPAEAGDAQAFNALVQHDKDLAWRNESKQFDGKVESGLFIPARTTLNAAQKTMPLRTKHVIDLFGNSIQSLFNNVWLLTPNNILIIYDAGVPDFVAKMPADIDYSDTPWITLGDPTKNHERALSWTPPLFDPVAKVWIVSAVLPLDVNGQWIGMLGHDIYLNKLLPALFQPSQRYQGEQHFLLDTQGNFIEAGPWQKNLEANPESFKPALLNEPDFAQLLSKKLSLEPKAFKQEVILQGKEYLAIGMIMPSVNWQYFRLIPIDEILAPMRQVFYALVGMVITIGLLIGFLIDRAVKRNIVTRLQVLADVVRRYANGELSARARLVGDDEIAKTSHEFDSMADQLKATLDAIPDLLFDLGLDGHYYSVHSPNDALLAAPAKDLIGKTVPQILLPEASAIVMSALQEAHETGVSQGKQFKRETPQGVLWFELSVAKKNTPINESPRFMMLSRDITERKLAAEEIRNLAFYDALTGLPNRRLLLNRLKEILIASEHSGRDGALLFLDLDHFKTLNDTLGHETGDLLLQQVASRLTSCVRGGDIVARLGGDEYVVVLENLGDNSIESTSQATAISKKILAALNQPYKLNKRIYQSTASIGITLFSNHKLSQDDLLKHADIAMYQAKKAGRNVLRLFDPQMQNAINDRAALEDELRLAIKQKQFELYYQIQVDSSDHATGAESLIRWQHPVRGMIPPFEFIPIAEESNLILPIGEWVLDTACAQIKDWQQDESIHNLVLSVNVSAKQFRQENFVAQVQAAVKRHAINPMQLKLELTESMLLDDVDGTIATMNALKEIGVQFSLDDFGTGYSSLQYLKRLPLNQLKIDQSFVRDIVVDPNDRAIVRTIIVMARSLNLAVIAEGVETDEQRQLLIQIGCTNFQGYLFGKPTPIAQFEKLLKQFNLTDLPAANLHSVTDMH